MSSRTLACVGLLVLSNVFMNLAWYGHLKWFPQKEGVATTWLAVAGVILFSWALALPEYALQVPANRLGHVEHGRTFTAAQLKVMQEAITLVVFTGISFFCAERETPLAGRRGVCIDFCGGRDFDVGTGQVNRAAVVAAWAF